MSYSAIELIQNISGCPKIDPPSQYRLCSHIHIELADGDAYTFVRQFSFVGAKRRRTRSLFGGIKIGSHTMSLTSFVSMSEVKAKLKPLRPKLSRKLNVPLKVEPRSKRYTLVGTAFDYLLRFELQRRAPHAVSERWIAEYAPEIICHEAGSASVSMDIMAGAAPDQYLPPEEIAKRMRNLLRKAKDALAAYLKSKAPTVGMQAELASHAIRLAKLDSVYRAWRLEPGFEEASPEDVQDLVDLLAIAPFDDLMHNKVLLLNPNFGSVSHLVCGADADLIAGNSLVDFKTTKKGEMNVDDLDQLLGYLLLARKHRTADPTFPAINQLELYFCRHGYLWSLEASAWTSNPAFHEIEQWFFQRADEVFGASKRAGK